MFPHLYGFRVNVSLIQEAASKELIEILEKCEGTKVRNGFKVSLLSYLQAVLQLQAIIWDESLSGPIGLVSKYTFLRERNVVKMLQLKPGVLPEIDVRNIIFITRPNLNLMNSIAENVHSIEKRQRAGFRRELFLYFLPRVSTLCENQLKNKGVYGSFTHVGELKCDFFPVDNDLLSMELKDSYRYVLVTVMSVWIHLLNISILVNYTLKMIQQVFSFRLEHYYHYKNYMDAYRKFMVKVMRPKSYGIY